MQLRQRKVIFESSFVDGKSHICWLSPLKFTVQTMKKAFGEIDLDSIDYQVSFIFRE